MTFGAGMSRRTRIIAGLILASSVAMAPRVPMAADGDALTATGLFPVHDSSGDQHGDELAWYLAPAIYQALKERGRELILLNPGANYSQIDETSALEYARSVGVRSALMSRFTPTFRTKASDNSPRLRVEVKAIDVMTGATLHSFTVSEEVDRKNLERGFDAGFGIEAIALPGSSGGAWIRYSDTTRKVEKRPLGKAVRHLAEAVRDTILGFNGGALVYPSAALHQGSFPAGCASDFKVQYTRQRNVVKVCTRCSSTVATRQRGSGTTAWCRST